MNDANALAGHDDAKAPGRRAANKADKLARITRAARELFVEKGFDATTMRDIAARANVGFGTIFDYSSSKRDFLFLLFNPQLDQVLDESLAAAALEPLILDKLMAFFGGYYALYMRDRALSRDMLRELNFFSEGAQAQKFLTHRARFLGCIADQVRAAIAGGEWRPADPALVGRIIFALYAWEVRRWLAHESPSLARGLTDLRDLLALQITGFAADRQAPAAPRTAP